jgi:hypothetical protein
MRRTLCAVSTILIALAMSGCTNLVQGEATAPSSRCLIEGYEDLPAVSLDCGSSVPVRGLAAGYTARSVQLEGRSVLYLITDEPLDNDTVMPPLNKDSGVVHQYAHAAVQGVQRTPNADVVLIVVSNDCPVEKLYDHPQLQLDCHDAGSLLGWQLMTQAGAVTVLSQSMVDSIETTAEKANHRTTYYELSVLQQRIS